MRPAADTAPAGASVPADATADTDRILALAITARALRRFWRRLRPVDTDTFAAALQAQARMADGIATQLENRYRRTSSKRWKDWVRKSLREGGRKVYQWVHQPESWPQATTMESPLTQLGRIEKEWRDIWSKGRPCVSSLNIEARQEEPGRRY